MVEAAIDIYSDAFVAPRRHELGSSADVLIASGARGVSVIRLLVTDDSAFDRLAAEIAGPWHGVIFAFKLSPALSCALRGQPGWSGHAEMAMVLRDVEAVRG